jgi:hypothetical protein
MKFKESVLAHTYLDGLKGIEIGGSAHNPFGLNTINVDKYGQNIIYINEQLTICGESLAVDVVAPGDKLPFADNEFDFVISSHVIEHFYSAVAALLEWQRVARKYIYVIAPHKARTFDHDRPETTITEHMDRYFTQNSDKPDDDKHWSVFTTESFIQLIQQMNKLFGGFNIVHFQDIDDKVGNGFAVVIDVSDKIKMH